VREDAIVLPDDRPDKMATIKPDLSGLSEGERKVAELVYEFVSNWGPHRHYFRAYNDLFDQLTGLPDWKSKEPLMMLYDWLREEKQR
jgi:hypothetical protein